MSWFHYNTRVGGLNRRAINANPPRSDSNRSAGDSEFILHSTFYLLPTNLLSSERLPGRLVAIKALQLIQASRIGLESEHFDSGTALGTNPSAGATIGITGAMLGTRLIIKVHNLCVLCFSPFAPTPNSESATHKTTDARRLVWGFMFACITRTPRKYYRNIRIYN